MPCAEGISSRSEEDILAYAKQRGWQCVVKADGLALGKGAHMCRTEAQVREAITRVKALGASGDVIVVQEFLQEGREISLHFFCDGTTARLMPSSVDHKTIDEAGKGLMTGGMGTISPDPALSEDEYSKIAEAIITPWLKGCEQEGIDFRGVLYPGVKLTKDGPKLLEFNARLGDTEAQTHLVRLETDLVEIAEATLAGTLERVHIQWKPVTSACVVLASEGYPGDVSKPKEVDRLFQRTLREFKTLHILVNNAGVYGPIGPSEEINWDEWVRAVEINLFGLFAACRKAVTIFKKSGYGKIINLSGGGATSPLPNFSAYAASKAAVVRLTETLSEELREHGIDVNAISPGPLNTRLLNRVLESGPGRVGKSFFQKALKQSEEGGVPLEKGAKLCVYLASKASDGITGKLISALWDPWQTLHECKEVLRNSDLYCLRRIVPKDRGFEW